MESNIIEKAKKIKLLLTDCDGVLTDTGVYYSAAGEELKRFSIRDGMGVERLRKLAMVETGIVTGEDTQIVKNRANKLKISQLHMGIKNKALLLYKIMESKDLELDEIAFIGDDTNDVEVMKIVGLSASPADATSFAKEVADVIVPSKGGHGAFRDFAEIIVEAKADRHTLSDCVDKEGKIYK
jgi:3-deoxy-D-manno-octulosonate 8-phosphate phosphatase (KDO 8-P phosphatase)